MVIIKNINWISEESLEAEVTITDGQFELLCFSHPFTKKKGEQIVEPLYVLDTYDATRLDSLNFRVEKLEGTFDYLIEGKLINKELGLIKLGNITIEIDSPFIPKDLRDGDYISFKCNRLDIY